MSYSPLMLGVLYAGLAGTALALIVATATNRWSPRVFFLLALRLAIGWHFLFEGLHKVNTYYAGPTDTNRVFTSEPYFKVAPGPIGEKMRKEFGDPDADIAAKVKAPESISPSDFAKLSVADQAAKCPPAVAAKFDALNATFVETMKADAEKELKNADDTLAKALKEVDDTEQRALTGAWTKEESDAIRAKFEGERRKIEATAEARVAELRERQDAAKRLAPALLAAAKDRPEAKVFATELDAVLKALTEQAEKDIKAAKASEEKSLAASKAAEQKSLKGAETDAEKAKVRADAEAKRGALRATAELAKVEAGKKAGEAESRVAKELQKNKAKYARWVYGVDARDCKVKGITGDVLLTGPQRIEQLTFLRTKAENAKGRETHGLGNGHGTDIKRVAEFRMDAQTATYDLARDAESFIDELTKDLNGGKAVTAEKPEPRGKTLDRVTMWFIVAVGAMLMGGLFTRLACVLAAGFLVMTYLAHPPFPWYPLPPNTEGNPVFINKNVIEALALLALACFPTGRWLGLDALVLRPFCKYRGECPPAA